MAFTSPEPPAGVASAGLQERIAQRTDARCLAQMLVFLRRSYVFMPAGLLVTYLGVQAGEPVWLGAWFVAWSLNLALIYREAGRLQSSPPQAASASLRRATVLWLRSGLLPAAIFPLLIVRTSENALLLATLMASMGAGSAVLAVSGVVRAYLAYAGPITVVLIVGWLWRGGPLGYFLALFIAVLFPLAISGVRLHRQALVELVTLLEQNEALTLAAAQARDRAEAASAAKTRFFAAASHDLRQPLHALSINATTLDLVARRAEDPVLRNISQGIVSALRQGRALLDALLDVSRLDAHAVTTHLAAHEAQAVLAAVRDEYMAQASERGLRIELAPGATPLWVHTDVDQLMRILGNLVDNAVKFTRQGGVQLSAQPAPQGGVLIRVSDSGPGIAAAEQERVFEEFYQVGNPARDRSQGLGLGLAIVRRTALLLGIELQMSSELGQGTVFELTLPAAEAAPATSAAHPTPLPAGLALSVLVVDDEPEALMSMCTYLQQLGWAATGAASSDGALRVLAGGFVPQVLAVDYRLQGETGLDVIARLRRQIPGLPAVLVTGDTSPARLREFLSCAALVLHKPVDGQELADALADAVRAQQPAHLA